MLGIVDGDQPCGRPMTAVGPVAIHLVCDQRTSMCWTFLEPGLLLEIERLPLLANESETMFCRQSVTRRCLNICLPNV